MLLVTILILFMLLLFISGVIHTIQMTSTLLNYAFYPTKETSTCPKNYLAYALWMLPQKLSAWISLINANWSLAAWYRWPNGWLKEKGCLDDPFLLKIALQTRKEFNLNTWVVFVVIVKVFDTVNRDMLMKMLAQFGLPEHLINVIRRLYKLVRNIAVLVWW